MLSFGMINKLFKYGLVGGSTFLVELFILYFLLKYTNIHYSVAITLLFILATISNYLLSRAFVFKEASRGWKTGYLFFLLIAIIGLLLTLGIVAFMVEMLNIDVLISRIVAVALVYLWNFGANQYFNFKPKSPVL